MFMLFAILPAFLVAWALGGRFEGFLKQRFRSVWLIWVALGVQLILFTPLGNGIPAGSLRLAHSLTYLPIIAFLVLNRAAGLALIAVGVATNFVAIVANGGLMPVDPQAQQAVFGAGFDYGHPVNTDATADHLLLLGDVMALPSWFPFANAFSIGDLLLAVGLVWAVARLSVGSSHSMLPPEVTQLVSRGRRKSVVTPFVAATVGWMVLAVTVGQAIGAGRVGFAVVLLIAGFGPIAAATFSAGFGAWAQSARIIGVAPFVIILTAVTARWMPSVIMLLAAVAAGLLMSALSARATTTAGRGCDPMRDVLACAAAALGLAVGAVLVIQFGWAVAAGIAGVIGVAATARRRDTQVSLTARRGEAHPSPGMRGLASGVVLTAVAVGLVGIGALATAAPVWATAELGLQANGFGLLGAALTCGVLCGTVMTISVSPVPTVSLVGTALLFCALSFGLIASSTLAMTAVAGAVVLGISVSLVAWIVRRQLSSVGRALGWSLLACGSTLGVLVSRAGTVDAMWALCIVVGGMGAGLVVMGIPNRVARTRLVTT